MDILTMEQEASTLRARFDKVNRAAFARDHDLKGGQALIYQHITGRRPISLEAALVYAKGFGCPLEEISPRLAREAIDASKMTGAQYRETPTLEIGAEKAPDAGGSASGGAQPAYLMMVSEPGIQMLDLFYGTDEAGRESLLDYAKKLPRVSLLRLAGNKL